MNKILYTIIFLSIFTCLPTNTQAANLYSNLSSELYAEQTFVLDVYTSTNIDETMNAVSGNMSFSQDKIEIISLSKNDSIFDLWINEPTFSNTKGTINFEGIVFEKPINEKNKIMSITFKVKEKGFAQIYFSSGSILSNDGLGTNILKELDSNTLLIN